MGFDPSIIIVGTGPAGSSTALHLAQRAPKLIERTLLLEKEHHPRPKLCGGALLEDGHRILDRLGLNPSGIEHLDVPTVQLLFQGKGPRITSEVTDTVFRVFDRAFLDGWLANQVRNKGFAIEEGVRVRQVVPERDFVKVVTDERTYRARAVVGADGSFSVVRRALAPVTASGTARLMECYVENVPPAAWESIHKGKTAIFDYTAILEGIKGYTWSFPMLINGRLAQNRGVFDLNNDKGTLKNLRPILERALSADGIDPSRCHIQGHPIRMFSAKGPFSSPGILLTGDAAGVDPLNGEGISFALGYGALAAEQLADAFSKQDFSLADYPSRVLGSSMGRALKYRRRLAQTLYTVPFPGVQRFFWWHMNLPFKWYVRNFVLDWTLWS